MGLGITAGDFTQILNNLKRTVSYSVMSKTIDPMTGDELLTYAAGVDRQVVFFIEENRYLFDKEGLLEVGDAYIQTPPSMGIKRYDKFTIGGQEYIIRNTTERYVNGVYMHDYGICYLTDKP